MSADDDGLKREVLSHAGNRWSLGVVHKLGVAGRLRHAELARRLDGVTQRMLTRSLRQLERDGLVHRQDHAEVPPRVEYELTWTWVIGHADEFRAARHRYDARSQGHTEGTRLDREAGERA
ncbi:MarR family transcriptional regulator [Stutzerimonas balearica]|uniref:winged helix-turn-helix transcriptional regulator n=1 Tax=Stutzerimonas balearica TaxID=74829 RepID=UPI0013F48B9B|nr:helix-turn-helix domain-containing protein [Stutzerimonas balearica]QIJ02655.1 MarR family transcriptional regulator [Stutzerimonas balearica]